MGTRSAMRSIENKESVGSEATMNLGEMVGQVIGMDMLDDLVTEDDIDGVWCNGKVVAIVEDKVEVTGSVTEEIGLSGNVDADCAFDMSGGGESELAVAGGDLEKRCLRGEERFEDTHASLNGLADGFRVLLEGQAGMMGTLLKESLIECGIKLSAGGGIGVFELVGELAFDFVAMP